MELTETLPQIYRYDKDGNINFHNELTQDKRKGWIAVSPSYFFIAFSYLIYI